MNIQVNFQDQGLFETEAIKENVVFKISSGLRQSPTCMELEANISSAFSYFYHT